LKINLLSERGETQLKNPNIEVRNPKQYQNPNFQKSKQKRQVWYLCFGHYYFGHSNLLEIWYSNFGFQ